MERTPTRYWFKNKTYGYGWTPATKEGWYAVLVWLLAFIAVNAYFLPAVREGDELAPYYAPAVLAPTLILLVVCYKKGEPLQGWHWGDPKKPEK